MQTQHTAPVSPLAESFGPAEEHLLVHDMLTGCERAWRAFHARYDRLIFQCITKVLGRSVSQDDVREVYATLLVQLLANNMHKLRMFDPERGARFGSFIGMLAGHCAHDYIRSRKRDDRKAPLSEAEVIACERPSPFEHVAYKERVERLESLLGDLPAKDREFVALYFGEELEPEQIAERMQISVKTVYTKRHKIQSRLEAMLSGSRLAA
jgi:RNA polymerase sigma-70 factor (ECF subfamily)